MPLSSGTRLNHYEVLSVLGQGGMGEVYLARDARLKRQAALKLLPDAYTQDLARVRRFEQEAVTASSLNHPNIITIYEIGQASGAHFIATEFVEGETLRQLMTRERLRPQSILDIAVQISSALSAAHAAGIVHRDIKPENIMLRRDGYVKVLDFGLAKLTESISPAVDTDAPTDAGLHTELGMIMGTVRYMSPEQVRGTGVDARTDIFSLGVVLYEMIAGRTPFEGLTAGEVFAAILERESPPLRRYAPEVSEELQRIVSKALAKEREERYQTIKDLQIDLRNLKQGSTAPSSVAPRLSTNRRHKLAATFVASILLVGSAVMVYFGPFRAKGPAIESLAVLPFVNVNADPNTEYLSEGITDSLINGLSQLPKLKVMSRNSVFRYKGREADAQAAGKQLGVRAVLTGRVVTRGDSLSIITELVDANDNSHLWGEQYNNRKLSDILAVQAEISRDISEKLRLQLSGDDRQRLTKRYTGDAGAYELYLKGRYYLNTLTDEGLKKGIEYFERAIEIDAQYAPAYAGMAESYAQLASGGAVRIISPQEAIPKAKAAAIKALELDESLAEAHTSLALIALTGWEWKNAEKEFKRSLELNPNYVNAYHWYSHCLISLGRFDESLVLSQRALALDPLDVAMNFHLGFHFFRARQYDQAITQLQKTIDMNPNSNAAHGILGVVLEETGRYDEAVSQLQKSVELGGFDMRASIGHVYAASGRKDEAQKILNQLLEESKQKYVSPYAIATLYEGLGNKDQAFAWLDRAFAEHDNSISDLSVDQELDSLRSDPRFAELLRRLGVKD
jgi:serine/threonine protein kinase/Tfp pilus assembly protein PilF